MRLSPALSPSGNVSLCDSREGLITHKLYCLQTTQPVPRSSLALDLYSVGLDFRATHSLPGERRTSHWLLSGSHCLSQLQDSPVKQGPGTGRVSPDGPQQAQEPSGTCRPNQEERGSGQGSSQGPVLSRNSWTSFLPQSRRCARNVIVEMFPQLNLCSAWLLFVCRKALLFREQPP